jgi:hypothetical protein
MLAKDQLGDAISCSLRTIELNRNISKAERDVGGDVPFGHPYLLLLRAPQGLPRPQQCVPEPEPADHSRGPHIHHASSRDKPGWQAGPVPIAPSHPLANQNERFAATLTLLWRDGLSGFRTCLRAQV